VVERRRALPVAPDMVSGDSPRAEELDEIDKNMETALRACIQDCITKRKGPYEPHEAEKLLRNVETEPPGDRRKAAVRECLHRFMFGGQVVCLKEITGKFQYRNGRVGLIKNDRPDEHGRFIVELNDFGDNGIVEQKWIRVPPTCIELQVGMNPGLFFDNRFELAMKKAGVPLPKRTEPFPPQQEAPEYDGDGPESFVYTYSNSKPRVEL